MNKNKYYQAYGININSDLPLPELLVGGKGENLKIHQGEISNLPKLKPTSIKRQGIEAFFGGDSKTAYLSWEGVVTFKAESGKILTVAPQMREIDPQFLNLYILSEALGMILFQQGLFLLHGSAVKLEDQDRAIIFIGEGGAGKSTTAAAFANLNPKNQVISDDLVAIEITEKKEIFVRPAFPQIKLWHNTINSMGYDVNSLTPLFQGSNKYIIKNNNYFSNKYLKIAGIYVLKDSPKLKITKMLGKEAFLSLLNFFPCPNDLLTGVDLQHHFWQSSEILAKIPILKLERPKQFDIFPHLVNQIISSLNFTEKPSIT